MLLANTGINVRPALYAVASYVREGEPNLGLTSIDMARTAAGLPVIDMSDIRIRMPLCRHITYREPREALKLLKTTKVSLGVKQLALVLAVVMGNIDIVDFLCPEKPNWRQRVGKLWSKTVDINKPWQGVTPLGYAVMMGDLSMVKALIARGADYNLSLIHI